jgi:diketogulonate reductase-like aldo/keto reductase
MQPRFIYGTAWKEQETTRLTQLALTQGFRAIDTANQRKHYHEAAVGEALRQALREGSLTRPELFVQSKFTHIAGQDHRLPYDPAAEPAEQVRQSFNSSLEHLGLDYLDSYVLHGPSLRQGWAPQDLEVWGAIEDLHSAGKALHIGVSNVGFEQLAELCQRARIRPHFVQNRCFARLGWDREVREVCAQYGVTYQGFSLLTANYREMATPDVQGLAARLGRTPAQLIFRFAAALRILPLTGTSDAAHMREDLEGLEMDLSAEDVELLKRA